MEAREEETSKEDLTTNIPGRFTGDESAGVMFAEWIVIGVGGKVSSLNAPAGVGGSKSK